MIRRLILPFQLLLRLISAQGQIIFIIRIRKFFSKQLIHSKKCLINIKMLQILQKKQQIV
jgi:hypothetical protein